VYLKSLSLRGFKSFADATTLEFEPGVTVIVGPNGSGKSNVVDAVAWVLGAQGPRVVRSSKMDDVIFAGTSKRPALGRAEVSLTIDNSSHRLPVDLAEVTITRTLFRTGESEYSMNGAACRLLDIQELLSDAGVGRQQHVIMGQGQLDTILQARPEDRRAVIEEAAGILKFRRRRERAERRIEATEANLLRIQDLHREVRRQLRPLERQAEAARRHDSLASELRALRMFVAGRELTSLERRLSSAGEARIALAAEDGRLKSELSHLDDLVAATEVALSSEQASDVVMRVGSAERLAERARGVGNVIAERRRSVALALSASTQSDVVASLEAEAARLDVELAETAELAAALAPAQAALQAEAAQLAVEEEVWLGRQPPGGASTAAQAPGEAARVRRVRDAVRGDVAEAREALATSAEREAALARRLEEVEVSIARAGFDVERLSLSSGTAQTALASAEDAEREAAVGVISAEGAARQAVEVAQGLTARGQALQLALDEAHARAGVEHLAGRPGVLGTLFDLVEIEDGCELAFESAVSDSLGAVVVDGPAARGAIEHLQGSGIGGALLRLEVEASTAGAIATSPASSPSGVAAPAESLAGVAAEGADVLRSCVRSTHTGVGRLLDRLLAGVVLCRGDLAAALDLVDRLADGAVVVTLAGDRFSAIRWRLGAGRGGATQAALEAVRREAALAEAAAGEAGAVAEQARQAHATARTAVAECARRFDAARAGERNATSQREELARNAKVLREQASLARSARSECELRAAELGVALAGHETALADAERFEREIAEVAEQAAGERRDLDGRQRAHAARQADLHVRIAGVEERRSMLTERRRHIDGRLSGFESARASAAARREGHEAAGRALERLAGSVEEIGRELEVALAALRRQGALHEAAVGSIAGRLSEARGSRTTAERELSAVRERSQRVELDLAELRVRLESAVQNLRHDLETEPAEAMAAESPELPPGMPAAARVRELERELRLLGPVNPLALEELAALEERDRFLAGQLEDVRAARRELGRVVRAVDEEIVNGFTEAFADVSAHFETLFSTLFPGGTGRLSLADPSDLLSTGVEIEARPAGRNVRRLSLLSGGERSLVALAYLFAVFRSRPSPFYLMDEVEAALDDINLHRFLDLMDEFRQEAQLLVVSHQKRTMESADVLYGVSLQPGGASKVLSERLGRRSLDHSAL
jgi:chromosome segregation protein